MDFVFRGFYRRNSSASHSLNYTTYYTPQPNQCDVESYNGGRYDHFLMERQLAKEMIRRDILAKEARRRELEAEVMRELREERDLELLRQRRGGDHWEPPHGHCYVERILYENRVTLPCHDRMYEFPRLEEGTIVRRRMSDFPRIEEGRTRGNEEEEELPFQRAPRAIRTQVKSSSDGGKQIISMAIPDTSYSGKKRKELSSPVEGPSKVTKKLTKEWSCDLCQINATSEQGLEDHLMGKKHKSKQVGQKVGMIGFGSKKIYSPPNPSQVVESVKLEKSQQISNKHETGVENNEIDIIMEKGCGGADRKMPKKKKMKFKFYCKMCEVGAFCEEVMANHKKGKKHLFRLHQLGAKR